MMSREQARRWAKSLLTEAGLIADTFDGTIGDGAFRNRVATLYYSLRSFDLIFRRSPWEFTDDDNPEGLTVFFGKEVE